MTQPWNGGYQENIGHLTDEIKSGFSDYSPFACRIVGGDDGAKFENLVAVSLLKHVYGKTDSEGKEHTLRYLRTKDGHEVDFALACQDEIEMMIEVKLSDRVPSKPLVSFYEKHQYPAIQLVKSLRSEYQQQGISVLKAEKFLSQLFL